MAEEIHLGFASIERPSKKLLEDLKKISSATAWGTLANLGFNNTWMEGIRSLYQGIKIIGPAVTVSYIAFREDRGIPPERAGQAAQNIAWEAATPGDVIVAEARGRSDTGVIGDCMSTGYKSKGVAGYVVDGSVRDSPYIKKIMFPVFSRGVTPTSTKNRLIPSAVNVPIQCAGVQIVPGDIIIGDDDGVIVIPRAKAEDVAEKGIEEEILEDYSRKLLMAGRSLGESYPPKQEWLKEPPI